MDSLLSSSPLLHSSSLHSSASSSIASGSKMKSNKTSTAADSAMTSSMVSSSNNDSSNDLVTLTSGEAVLDAEMTVDYHLDDFDFNGNESGGSGNENETSNHSLFGSHTSSYHNSIKSTISGSGNGLRLRDSIKSKLSTNSATRSSNNTTKTSNENTNNNNNPTPAATANNTNNSNYNYYQNQPFRCLSNSIDPKFLLLIITDRLESHKKVDINATTMATSGLTTSDSNNFSDTTTNSNVNNNNKKDRVKCMPSTRSMHCQHHCVAILATRLFAILCNESQFQQKLMNENQEMCFTLIVDILYPNNDPVIKFIY
jgi:hypothetical protein